MQRPGVLLSGLLLTCTPVVVVIGCSSSGPAATGAGGASVGSGGASAGSAGGLAGSARGTRPAGRRRGGGMFAPRGGGGFRRQAAPRGGDQLLRRGEQRRHRSTDPIPDKFPPPRQHGVPPHAEGRRGWLYLRPRPRRAKSRR